MNKKIIGFIAAFFVLAILFGFGHFLNKKEKKELNIPENSCLVQYNSCSFIESKSETWESGCSPIFKEFFIKKIGEQKVLVVEKKTNQELIFPKNLIRNEIDNYGSPVTNSLFLYVKTCEEKIDSIETKKESVEINNDKELDTKKDDSDIFKDLPDKCIVLKNDCENIERWEEEKHCHPIKKSYKVLEVGSKNLRVVIWNGHGELANGRLIAMGSEYSLTKNEYRTGYEISDCSELLLKYPKTFNPLKGK